MPEFKIEHDVPLPEKFKGRYPWKQMAIGDSFFVVGGKQQTVASAANEESKRHGGRFRTSIQDGGVRVWRVA